MKIINFFLVLFSITIATKCEDKCDPINPLLEERNLRPQIVGGQVAPHVYPYMASIQSKSGSKWSHYCGATLINSQWLLTAGHCVKYLPPNPGTSYRAVLGAYDLRKIPKTATIRTFKKIVMNPGYYGTSNDIALIQIPPITNIKPINMSSVTYPSGTMTTVIGWGSTKEGSGVMSPILMQVSVPIVANDVCKKAYPFVSAQNVCAGDNQHDACQGDSGGPLFVNVSGSVNQLGIVTYGRGCGQPGYPGVYSSVPYYLKWIQSVISGTSKALEEE
jgi:secreted trypsin-like serine protease